MADSWRVVKNPHRDDSWFVVRGTEATDSETIARHSLTRSDFDDEVTARLLAAAPELVAALVTIVHSIINDSDACVFCKKDVYFHDSDCPILFAVKALAKVEGH